MKKISYSLFTLVLLLLGACSTDSLDPTLSQSRSVEDGIVNVDNLHGILKGAHNIMSAAGYYGRDLIVNNEVRSDNCFSNGNSGRFSTQAEYLYNENTDYIWNNAYNLLANVNVIIGANLSSLDGNQEQGRHIQGQAMVLRALAHYDLLRVFGQQHTKSGGSLGVPIVTTFNGDDLFPKRSSIDEVKAAIYDDLETAYGMMDTSFDTSKTIVSKYVAKALEARVAIYFGDWDRALTASEVVIDSGMYGIIGADAFVNSWTGPGTVNVIFELAYSNADNLGPDAISNIYRFPGDAPGGYGDVQVVSDLIELYEENDVRRDILGYQDSGTRLRNMKKYPDTATGTDNIPLFRYEEVILNYAEALFETGGNALAQLNLITANRGASAYVTVTKEDILKERRKELMFEGFRFDDLTRTGMDIEILGSLENSLGKVEYPSNLLAYPIPLSEINANSNVVQNAGY
ncbi:RagB/SusD family nutrient uptake outer membrane protein [Aquimarina gracilis]|uniref:RagB/SusD family nutrient uptake outer membrane protein n=1 Tax=Aquimarina gracilis TaxID=874422 RepID=A0ABU5ZTM6_9FLAO|nr:RagB/SusD family nutrient uptake outer membrane protein [Aquimarina gracilis]MEB3345369.1 RagB/SusD family nutrient uptake outer membrane protein [Aquimarina gracilis]